MLTDSQEAGHVPYVYEEISFLSFLLFSKRSVFSFKVAYEQALYLGQSQEPINRLLAVARSHTKAARETDDASTWGGWLASLALNGELASRLYDQGIIFTSFLK